MSMTKNTTFDMLKITNGFFLKGLKKEIRYIIRTKTYLSVIIIIIIKRFMIRIIRLLQIFFFYFQKIEKKRVAA